MKKLIVMMVVLTGCASQKEDSKSSLDQTKDKNASMTLHTEAKARTTIISGRIQMDDPFIKLPSNIELSLISKGQVILRSQMNAAGNFSFQGNIPNGEYLLKASAVQFSGQTIVIVDGRKITEVLVTMSKVI
jgi:lipopolysaccharide export system protein LptA